MKKVTIKKGDKLLFVGDSITDNDRDRSAINGLTSYNRIICEQLEGIEGFNRGISGSTVYEVLQRFEADCAQTKPTVISILAGINDSAPRGDGFFDDPASFEAHYRALLTAAFAVTPRVVVLEPFLIRCGEGREDLVTKFFERMHTIRKIAHEFDCVYVPLDGLFARVWIEGKGEDYSPDCIHLTQEGKEFVARQFLDAVAFKA